MSVGGLEWLWIILFILVLLVGSKKLPELARAMGRAMGEFQKGKIEIERELRETAVTPKSIGSETDREKLERTAKKLGIETSGKSVEELKEEIIEAICS